MLRGASGALTAAAAARAAARAGAARAGAGAGAVRAGAAAGPGGAGLGARSVRYYWPARPLLPLRVPPSAAVWAPIGAFGAAVAGGCLLGIGAWARAPPAPAAGAHGDQEAASSSSPAPPAPPAPLGAASPTAADGASNGRPSLLVRVPGGKDLVVWVDPVSTLPELDWDCPCLEGVKESPCGPLIMNAMRCYLRHRHVRDGVACREHFEVMSACMKEHMEDYPDFAGIFEQASDPKGSTSASSSAS